MQFVIDMFWFTRYNNEHILKNMRERRARHEKCDYGYDGNVHVPSCFIMCAFCHKVNLYDAPFGLDWPLLHAIQQEA